jgi:hypothetical protein
VAGGGAAAEKLADDDKTKLPCAKTHGTKTKRKLRKGELTQRLGTARGAAEKEIGRRGRSSGSASLGRRCRGEVELE